VGAKDNDATTVLMVFLKTELGRLLWCVEVILRHYNVAKDERERRWGREVGGFVFCFIWLYGSQSDPERTGYWLAGIPANVRSYLSVAG